MHFMVVSQFEILLYKDCQVELVETDLALV